MKFLRTFILVLLTVLLPIRGAVAAAMLCPGGSATAGVEVDGGHQAHHTHGGQGDAAGHQPVHEHAGHTHNHNDRSGESSSDSHSTACQFCAGGGCCVTPLAFAPPSVELPRLIASASFPDLTARVTAFYPDGQDRPPRTI